jgi:pyruvate kinase
LETHLDWLLSQLEPRSEAIRDLLESGIDVDFFCFSAGSTEKPPSLPRAIRDRAEALGIRIDIDHYPE